MYYADWPTALYGLTLLMPAVGYTILQRALIGAHASNAALGEAIGHDTKGRVSLLLYVLGISATFFQPWLAVVLYGAVALIWLVPDRRIERVVAIAD